MSTMSRRLLTTAVVIVASMIAAARITVHFVQHTGGPAQLYWNDDELFLFIGVVDRGWVMSPAGVALESVASAAATAWHPVSIDRSSVWAFTYTRSGLQRHVLEGAAIGPYVVVDNALYTFKGEKWTGSGFEMMPDDSLRRVRYLMTAGDATALPPGWYRASLFELQAGRQSAEIHTAGQTIVVRSTQQAASAGSVDIQIDEQPVQRLCDFENRAKLVSDREYRSTFGI